MTRSDTTAAGTPGEPTAAQAERDEPTDDATRSVTNAATEADRVELPTPTVGGDVCALAGLRILRNGRGLSLHEAARLAKMSPGYLQKLERCEIKNPSPHKLHRLASVLGVSYQKLMELAGYPDPTAPPGTPPRQYDCVEILNLAARSAGIEQKEAEILAQLALELADAKRDGVDIKREMLPRVVRSMREAHKQGLADNLLEDAVADVDVSDLADRVTATQS